MACNREQLHGTININKTTTMKVTFCKRQWLENADKTASMETVQPDGSCAGLAAAVRKPHQWKCSLIPNHGNITASLFTHTVSGLWIH